LKLTTGPGEETLCHTKKDLRVGVVVRDLEVTPVQKAGGADQSVAKAP